MCPMYSYICPECLQETNEMNKIDERDDQVCSKCGKVMDRQIGAPAFHLKGRGWAKDGYCSKVYVGESDSGE